MDHTAVTFKLEAFEGPLDLLLHLIVRNKVDIMDIPVAMILDQYLEYLDQMQEMDMEVAGDFILMASQLIFIKTKMLLPDEDTGEEEDPRAELAATLLEYRKIKQAGIWLGTCQAENAGYYSKIPEPQQPVSRRYTYSHSPMDLVKAIHEMTERAKQAMPPPLHMFDEIVEREPEPIEGKINWNEIVDALSDINYKGIWLYEVAFGCLSTLPYTRRSLTCEDFVRNAKEIFEKKPITKIL